MPPNNSAVTNIANECVISSKLIRSGIGCRWQRQAFCDGYLFECFFKKHTSRASDMLQVGMQLRVSRASVGTLAAVFLK